jgi:predicted RNase H-like HicB family nuclease
VSHDRIEVVRVGSTEIEVYIHQIPKGGFWAEVPSMPWCATQGDTVEQVLSNVEQSIRAVLGLDRETGS